MYDTKPVCGLILAAGLSRRMGDFKPLMPFKGKTLIECTVDSMLQAGVKQVVIVLGYRGNEIQSVLSLHYGSEIIFTYNPNYATTDMLTSIKYGLRVMPPCEAFFLLPGDMPVVKKSTFLKLLKAHPANQASVIFPTLEGYRKHPPLIDFTFLNIILNYQGDGGLRQIWRLYEDFVIHVPVDDEGVWVDLDTKKDYELCIRKFCTAQM
ncbi:nucleotidyltransferase family protein [Blautia liquoris]|uniref:Nucleotidyltransferase family protein n=1 Tax=Blautia liquoris TaxID=2779518 RepID=A0A7M2RGL7_9FIRM|nr:nucleotidyltransferase family protein [Blautia liquoris]QOV18492.1 nucleotidyltransferase family protein [Blautia liquoris]